MRRLTTSRAALALRECLVEHDWTRPIDRLGPLLAGYSLDGLIERAARHGVESPLYASLRGLDGMDHAALHELQRRRAQAIGLHMRALSDLAAVRDSLDAAGIPWLIFKGPVLAEAIYPRNDLRAYVDLDVLVPRRSFAGAVSALESAGIGLMDKNWALIRREQRGQLHFMSPHGTIVDLHWHLLTRSVVRDSFSIDTRELFERSRSLSIGGMTVRTFDPVDTLVHLCLHAGLSGAARLLWLKDVERATAAEPAAWDDVVLRARRWGGSMMVAAVLRRARRIVRADVPPNVIEALAGSRLMLAGDATIDRLWPIERSLLPRSLPLLWTRMLRNSPRESVALGAARVRAARSGAVRSTAENDGLAVLTPSGTEEDRSLYFRGLADAPSEEREA